MEHFREQPRFEIQPAIEQKPFEDPAVQSFFTKWCEINDLIQPQYVSRKVWEQRCVKGILEKRPDGKHTLYIPKDLQLWEMIGVMEVVDHDTFAMKPERQDEAKKKLLELGKTFQDAGVYIAQRLSSIGQGQEIARALAEEFYDYGLSLVGTEKHGEPENADDIASHTLTGQEITTIDRFLAGDSLYESRRARAEKATAADMDKKEELYETERQKTLAQFFRASAQAFELKRKSESGKLQVGNAHLEPWQNDTPIHAVFLDNVKRAMVKEIETPRREFDGALFRRGLEILAREIREGGWRDLVNRLFNKLGIDLRIEQKKIADRLNLSQLKAELESVRQTGDVKKMSATERKIANKIQAEVSILRHQDEAHNPTDIVEQQHINCLGASMLSGKLMQEVGLKYLVGTVPTHSILVLTTADGKVYWYDMLNADGGREIKDKDISGVSDGQKSITIKDVAHFANKPDESGLRIEFRPSSWYLRELEQMRIYPISRSLLMAPPEKGEQFQLFLNTGILLAESGRYEEAIEMYHHAVVVGLKHPETYCNLGVAFGRLAEVEGDPKKRQEYLKKAIAAHRRAIALDPKYPVAYFELGAALRGLSMTVSKSLGIRDSRYAEAQVYQKFLDLTGKRRVEKRLFWGKRRTAKGILADIETDMEPAGGR